LISEKAGEEQAGKEYDKLIKLADQKFNEGNYEEAKTFYKRSKTYKPEESYPDQKIAEADKKLGELNAQEVEYNKLVASADGLFEKKDFVNAKADYNKALKIFDREYPRRRLADLEKEEKKLADKEAAAEAEKNKEARYASLIKEADELLSSKNYESSKEKYKAAYDVMPEKYPQDQVTKINKILASMQDEEQAELQYKKIIDAADSDLKSEKFDNAETLYKRANSLRPEDPYPLEQIAKIG